MALWDTTPPEARTRETNWATLLFSWWCTAIAFVIILTRLAGRKLRTGRLFREDKVMALSLIPLVARMGLVHVILLYGTNNVGTDGLSEDQIHMRSIGSKLVLASRIMYALFIWVSKFTVSEFLKRLTSTIWRRSYELTLHCIRIFLVVTFIGVVIATLSECQPFDHYWQVVPDPGPRCRQGYAQLLTMGTADMITDIFLVIFPIPLVLRTPLPFKRKLSTVCLFSLSILLIVITGMRMPHVISHRGSQQYRTIWASAEILASAAASNAVILGSFVRDRGIKRNKYRRENTADSIDRASVRRATLESYHRDSDENLFRAIGCRMPEDLCRPQSPLSRPAPAILPPSRHPSSLSPLEMDMDTPPSPHDSADALRKASGSRPSVETGQSLAFFDVGGLLESDNGNVRQPSEGTIAHDFALPDLPRQPPRRSSQFSDLGRPPSPVLSRTRSELENVLSPVISRTRSLRRQMSGFRERPNARSRSRPNTAERPPRQSLETVGDEMLLQDVGGLLHATPSSRPTTAEQLPSPSSPPTRENQDSGPMNLQDVGGLLK